MALMGVLVVQSVVIWTLTGMLEDSRDDTPQQRGAEPPRPNRPKNQLRTAQEKYEKRKNDIL